jgi:glutathione-regulated potassium-efflux system ancillary protein KefC
VVLTFNAGSEIDPGQLRRTARASLLIGGVSFAVPFGVVLVVCRYGLGWTGSSNPSSRAPSPRSSC